MKIQRAPSHLGQAGKKFWKDVQKDFAIEDSHDLVRLEQACQCLDRIREARETIEREGSFYQDRFGQPKEHPGHACERQNKILFCRILREMGLDLETAETRLPRQYGG